jgi:hypothetical protein
VSDSAILCVPTARFCCIIRTPAGAMDYALLPRFWPLTWLESRDFTAPEFRGAYRNNFRLPPVTCAWLTTRLADVQATSSPLPDVEAHNVHHLTEIKNPWTWQYVTRGDEECHRKIPS